MSLHDKEVERAIGAIKKNSSRAFIAAIGLVAILILGLSSWVYVGPTETAVITRFGRVHAEHGAGFHLKLPWPIEDAEEVQTRVQQSFTLGEPDSDDEIAKTELAMLTRDTGIVQFKCAIQYRVKSATQWLVESTDPKEILENLAICAVRQTSGIYTFYEMSVDKRSEAQDTITQELQKLADAAEIGVQIINVQIKDSHPPEEVKGAFENVMKSNEKKGQRISEGQAEVNKTLPRAQGNAQEWVNVAKGDAIRIVNAAKAEAAVFNEMYEQYKLNPEATKARMVYEANEQALAGKKRVIDMTGTQGVRQFGVNR